MGGVQHNLWVPGVLFLLGGLIQWGGAIVLVEFQSGPLYRVIGHPLSISCNVSGFSNPLAQQDFQLSIYKPNKPGLEIQIISTIDKDFSMGGYGRRVRAGEISVERLSVTSVLFKVMSLGEGDEGEYECHTPNSETIYLGTYHARTTVNGNVFKSSSHIMFALVSLSQRNLHRGFCP
nr:Immunoglobulin superfamily member 2 precursor [Esox lucius]